MNTLSIDWKNNLRQKTRTEIGSLKAKALIRRWEIYEKGRHDRQWRKKFRHEKRPRFYLF